MKAISQRATAGRKKRRATARPGGEYGGEFVKLAECLFRYSSNQIYYAFLKQCGKKKRQSPETTDLATAKRKLGEMRRDSGRVDASQGKLTLRELVARYNGTV